MTSGSAVTVVMPVRNNELFIADAIQSCLSQSRPVFELLVADDGSTDDSVIVARSQGDARVVVIPGRPSNPSAARNRAIARAKGDFVALLDADDLWYAHKLERQLPAFDADDVVAVGGFFRFRIGNRAFGQRGQRLTAERCEELKAGRFMPVTTSSLVIRSRALREVGPFDETLARAADLDMLARLARIGRIVILEEVLGEYRIHSGGVSRENPAEHQRWGRFVAQRIEAREAGFDLTWEEFSVAQGALSPREKRRIRSAALYREAGNVYSSGRRVRGLVTILQALLVDPRYTVSKIWQQKPWRLV